MQIKTAMRYHLTLVRVAINKNSTKILIPLYEGELKYFYDNYKDYFYLPEEDMAIHKSVATFVDKQYRERAKASNCYTRKKGTYLPQLTTIMSPTFKLEHKDKVSYFELTQDFGSSDVMLRRYVNHIFEFARVFPCFKYHFSRTQN